MPGYIGFIIIGAIVLILILIIVNNVKIVPQAHAYVIERLGAYYATWGTGIHFKIPFIDRISQKVSLKEQVIDFPPQPVITRDNVTMQIDTVVYFEITDPKLYCYGVERPLNAIENLTATTLRNIIGDLELDNTLTSRDTINGKRRKKDWWHRRFLGEPVIKIGWRLKNRPILERNGWIWRKSIIPIKICCRF